MVLILKKNYTNIKIFFFKKTDATGQEEEDNPVGRLKSFMLDRLIKLDWKTKAAFQRAAMCSQRPASGN